MRPLPLWPSPPACSLAASAAHAQSGVLTGKVTRVGSGEPMGGAAVVIEELRREARTGEDGTYRFESLAPGPYHVSVRAEGYSSRRTEVTVGRRCGHARPRGRPRPALRRGAVGESESAAAVRVLPAHVGAVGRGPGAPAPGHHRRDAPGRARRGDAIARPGPARPVIRGLDGDRVLVLQDGQRIGDLSSQSGDHGVPVNPGVGAAHRGRPRAGHAALRRQRHRRPRQHRHRPDPDARRSRAPDRIVHAQPRQQQPAGRRRRRRARRQRHVRRASRRRRPAVRQLPDA